MALRQLLGNLVDMAATKYYDGRGKDFGVSEWLAGNQPTTNTGISYGSKASGYTPYSSAIASTKSNSLIGVPQTNIVGADVHNTVGTPSVGGQGIGVGGSGGSGGTGGGSPALQPPVFPQQGGDQSVDILKQQYANNANDLNNQGSVLDQTYNISKGDIENSLNDTTKAAEAQKAQTDKQFGDILKNQLKTYQDLGRQRQGTFSTLGTLDSSAFGEQQFRADQELANQKSETDLQKQNTIKSIDDTIMSYKKNAQSQLAQLGLQWQQGKNSIASALANNNLQGAAAIQSALDQIRQRAADIQNKMIDFQNRAALLKSQGRTVASNIAGINGDRYGQAVGQQLQSVLQNGQNTYTVPQNQAQGQGFIAPNGKKYNPLAEFLKLGGA